MERIWFRTNIPDLDDQMELRNGRMYLVTGKAGVGATALALQMGNAVLKQTRRPGKVNIIDLENGTSAKRIEELGFSTKRNILYSVDYKNGDTPMKLLERIIDENNGKLQDVIILDGAMIAGEEINQINKIYCKLRNKKIILIVIDKMGVYLSSEEGSTKICERLASNCIGLIKYSDVMLNILSTTDELSKVIVNRNRYSDSSSFYLKRNNPFTKFTQAPMKDVIFMYLQNVFTSDKMEFETERFKFKNDKDQISITSKIEEDPESIFIISKENKPQRPSIIYCIYLALAGYRFPYTLSYELEPGFMDLEAEYFGYKLKGLNGKKIWTLGKTTMVGHASNNPKVTIIDSITIRR